MWFKLDDGFYAHPKVLQASLAAVGLWARAASWSCQQLADGLIPVGAVAMLGGSEELAEELIASGLWERADHGYSFHDWGDWQPDAESVRATRAAKSEGGAQGNHARWHTSRGVVVAGCAWCDRSSDRISDGVSESLANPPDPNPTRSTEEADASSVPRAERADVEELLDLLDAEIRRNGSKTPARSEANRDAMRLLLDRDGRTSEQIAAAIRWCQADTFWRGNVLSAVKLRDKYDQLRLAAQHHGGARPSRAEQNLAAVQRIAARESAERRGVAS